MSRREHRSYDSKRLRSRFDREPRRDGKPETERPPAEPELDKGRLDRDHKNYREFPLSRDSKVESGIMSNESENRADGHQRGTKHSSDPTKVPQSRSYFQHDDRGSVGQIGRSFSRRTDNVNGLLREVLPDVNLTFMGFNVVLVGCPINLKKVISVTQMARGIVLKRGWWRDPKEHQNDKAIHKTVSSDTQQKDEKPKDNREDNRANPKPPVHKRPSFREQKIPDDPEKTNKATADSVMPNPQNHAVDSSRRDKRGEASRRYDKSERQFAGERDLKEAQAWRCNFSSRDDRSGGNNRYRDRDGFTHRQGYRPSGSRVDKWKHDLYNEANRSPTPKNEEDQISKIEALLAL
ncbi:hypothetical protein DH2020_045275 [Rehmannia glutinosa]|uniref:Uncharacterized protein n=1 Tax=Rehmannia glutinosa TaxID=99300 RepID=A0ABR0UFB9_REHGL